MDEKKDNSILLPKLSDAQIAEIAKFAHLKSYKDGEAIYEAGALDICFFVIKSGRMEIVDCSGEQDKTVTVAKEKQFSGSINLLTGDPTAASAIAKGECEVYEVSVNDLRQILKENSSLSDIILQTFIARRQHIEESEDLINFSHISLHHLSQTV